MSTQAIELGRAAHGRSLTNWMTVVTAVAAAFVAFELVLPVHVDNAGIRAGLETAITIFGLAAAGMLLRHYRQLRRSRDLMLLTALGTSSLVDFFGYALPALAGRGESYPGLLALLLGNLLIASAFAAAAWAPAHERRSRETWLLVGGFAGGAVLISALDLVGMIAHPLIASTGAGASLTRTAGLIFAGGLLLLAANGFLRVPEHADNEPRWLAAAAMLLAVAGLGALAMPALATDEVTPALGVRVIAYGLVLVVVIRQQAKLRDAAARQAVAAERERIARDLHDGLAQDLAFIAAHSDRLAADYGGEHPLAVAARRALAVSRGAIVDLAASSEPTTTAALEAVADELERRHGIEIDVRAPDRDDLNPAEREEVVRIAREAIVNAVKHGRANRVIIELGSRGSGLLLQISDNGCGITPQPECLTRRGGFGLPAMRARAATLGGRVEAGRRRGGGTDIKLLV